MEVFAGSLPGLQSNQHAITLICFVAPPPQPTTTTTTTDEPGSAGDVLMQLWRKRQKRKAEAVEEAALEKPLKQRKSSPSPVLPQPNLQPSREFLHSSLHSIPSPNACIAVARSESDPSHQLFFQRGVIYCRHCGNYGTVRFIKLLKPCQRPTPWKNSMGYKNLDRIHRNIAPSPLLEWPLNISDSPPAGAISPAPLLLGPDTVDHSQPQARPS
jgi:hypothetical protein